LHGAYLYICVNRVCVCGQMGVESKGQSSASKVQSSQEEEGDADLRELIESELKKQTRHDRKLTRAKDFYEVTDECV
jgi:hypothetical protein